MGAEEEAGALEWLSASHRYTHTHTHTHTHIGTHTQAHKHTWGLKGSGWIFIVRTWGHRDSSLVCTWHTRTHAEGAEPDSHGG